MLNQVWTSVVPSWLEKRASTFSLPAFDLFGAPAISSTPAPAQAQVSPLLSFDFPKFMDMDLFSPMGFMSFLGLVVAVTLPLWAICGLAFKGSLWYLKNDHKK